MGHLIGSFREWLKHPRLFRKQADEYRRQLVKLNTPADARSIQTMVEQLLLEKPGPLAHEQIRSQGARAVPSLVQALQDPRFWKEKFGEGFAAQWPIERVLGILAFINPPEAIAPAAALLSHADGAIRAGAARLLGGIGNDACSEPVIRALRDENRHVVSWAVYGIRDALNAKRCTPGFLQAIFDPLADRLEGSDVGDAPSVAACLLQIDRNRAMSGFLNDRIFRADNPRLICLLREVNSAGETIPADKLRPLLESLRARIDEEPQANTYAAALVAFGRSGSPDAESLIRRELDSADKGIQFGAAAALAALKGALPPQEWFYKMLPENYPRLTQPQRVGYCVSQLSMEVNNGGLSQYFFNSSGDHSRDALTALQTINAKCTASLLQQAIAQFDPPGPSTNRETRQDQLAAFSEQEEAELSRLDAEFFKYPDNLEALLSRYAAEHPEHFKSEPL